MNKGLAESFQTLPMLAALSKAFVNPPDYVAGARWRAIRAVCTATTVRRMGSLLAVAFAILVSNQTAPTQNLVGALRLVSHALSFSDQCVQWIDHGQLFDSVLGLFKQFDRASIFHGAVREFITVVLRHRRLRDRMLEIFLPFILTEATERKRGCIAATCMELIEAIYSGLNRGTLVSRLVSDNAEFAEVVRTQLSLRRRMLSMAYGGGVR
jgi:hypothetical protein